MAEKKFITCDGNYAAAHVAYMFSEVAAIYPITPSSTDGRVRGRVGRPGPQKHLRQRPLKSLKCSPRPAPQAPCTVPLQSGALTSTFTASQGLLLMIPNMYKISGELLPGVFHVSARALAAQSLSHLRRSSGCDGRPARPVLPCWPPRRCRRSWTSRGIAHLVPPSKARVPFLHFFDGFRTSHEIQKIEADRRSRADGAARPRQR